ncbi:MAG: RNA polymerase sigma factor [Planctomycetes bacterium]|nr:RNA polymerase sigma factor [Planctomycetota bacterium]
MNAIERLLRESSPRVLAALARRVVDFASAEDAVQEACLAAAAEWPAAGVPDNPGGWLYAVALRRALDRRDSDTARTRREHEVAAAAEKTVEPRLEDDPFATEHDDALALLFTCCHPALTEPSAIALTLRAVGGLTTAEIAAAFFVPEATMAQRISRAKQTIAASEIPFALPTPHERGERLAVVLHVLYLIFSEGHATSSGPSLQRVESSREAIRLTRQVNTLLPDDPEVAGLLALMLLTDARRGARTGPNGEIVPLDEQDRSLWDRAAVAEGSALVTAAFRRGAIGSYQIQAAIASLHAEAPSVEATDWPQILALYDLLLRLQDNPMVALNRVVAVAMVHGAATALTQLEPLAADPRLADGHRLLGVRAHLRERAGDAAGAIADFRAAAARAPSVAERTHLFLRAARLEPK